MVTRKHREHVTTGKQKAQLEAYGVTIQHVNDEWFAFHVTGGSIGPFKEEHQLILSAYDKWILNEKDQKERHHGGGSYYGKKASK